MTADLTYLFRLLAGYCTEDRVYEALNIIDQMRFERVYRPDLETQDYGG